MNVTLHLVSFSSYYKEPLKSEEIQFGLTGYTKGML